MFHSSSYVYLIYVFTFTDVVLRSRFWALWPPVVRSGLLGVMMILIAWGALRSWISLQRTVGFLFLLFIGLFLWQLIRFSEYSGRETNLNALGQLYAPLSFVFFACFPSKSLMKHFAQATFVFGLGYALIYLVLAMMNLVGVLPRSISEALALNDVERGLRLYLAIDILSLLFFLCVTGYKQGLLAFIAITIIAVDVGFSLSRFFIAIFGLVFVLDRLRSPIRIITAICWLIFLVPSILMVYGLYDHAFNPFSIFAGDLSGGIRFREYEIARTTILFDPIWGVGFPSADTDLAYSVSSKIYSTSDIGLANVWSTYGIVGTIIFLFFQVPITSVFRPNRARDVDAGLLRAFHLQGCVLVAYSAISPLSMVNPGSIMFGVALAIWLRRSEATFDNPLTWRHLRETAAVIQRRVSSAG